MKKCCNCNCCNHLCWFCFLFSAEELGALKTTLNDWQHHQQLETLTLEAVTSWADPHFFLSSLATTIHCTADSRRQTAGGRQTEADRRRHTAGGRQLKEAGTQQTWALRPVSPLIHPMRLPRSLGQPSQPPNGATSNQSGFISSHVNSLLQL